MTSAFSWQNFILAFALLHSVLQGQICSLLQVFPNRWRNSGRLYFGGAPKLLQMVTAAIKLRDAFSLEEKL